MKTAVENTGGTFPDDAPLLGFLIAGYDKDGKLGMFRQVVIPGGDIMDPGATTTTLGVLWRGQTDVIGRIIHGVDWSIIDRDSLPDDVAKQLDGCHYALLDPITLQDAVDYACFLVRTTVDMQRFSDGTVAEPASVPGCGGETLVALVTRDGVVWVAERELRPPSKPGLAEGTMLSGSG
jgi:hypothetical protein